ERGDIAAVAAAARKVVGELKSWIARGYDVIALVPSCALMLKFEWPLILPDDADVKLLSRATYDCSEYIVDIAKKEGLAGGLTALQGGITLHMACHARAQNMGQKAAEMLRLLPETKITVIERCSGQAGGQERNAIPRLRMPACRHAHRPGHRTARRRGAGCGLRASSDRAVRAS